MSIDYIIDETLYVVIPYRINAFDDVTGVFDRIMAEPSFSPPAKFLFDARHTDYGPPSEELEHLAGHLARIEALKRSRYAIVAHKETLIYGLARMFCCLAESVGIRAEPFLDYDEARQWLFNPNLDFPPPAMPSPFRPCVPS